MLTKHLKKITTIYFQIAKNSTFYSKVPEGKIDSIFGVLDSYMKCKDPQKVNLSIGTYKDDNGQPFVFECVKKAQKILFDKNLDNEYPPIQGMPGFMKASLKLAYGENFQPMLENRIATQQTLSGSGAYRIALEFFQMFRSHSYVSVPAHSWPNHTEIPKQIRYPFKQYRYYDYHGLNFIQMKDDILNLDNESLIMFQACSHNPTGVDIPKENWKTLRDIIIRKKLYVFIDMAYQGFTSGDVVEDAFAVRFLSEIPQIPLLVGQSYSKNMGMYGQRAGMLSIVTNSVKEQEAITSQLKHLSRMSCSVPPIHGARIVETVLTTPELYQLWLQELSQVAGRIKSMREQLVQNIVKSGSKLDWSHLTKQQGMFAFTGLTKSQVAKLAQDHAVYMTYDGRISVPGLNTKNVEYVGKAFHTVTKAK